MYGKGDLHDLVALAVKSPSNAVPNLIRLLRDPRTPTNLHVCLQEPDDIMYLPSLWWHMTINIGEAFGLGYKATDFAFQELELVKSTSSYAQDLFGNLEMAERKLKEAESLYLKATTGEPFQAQFVPSYVRVLAIQNRFDEALAFLSQRMEYLDYLWEAGILPADSFCEIISQMASSLAPVSWYTMRLDPFLPYLRQDPVRNQQLAFALFIVRKLIRKAHMVNASSSALHTVHFLSRASDAMLVCLHKHLKNVDYLANMLYNAITYYQCF
jgi:hypothetical protein